jgi:hypothetical protein
MILLVLMLEIFLLLAPLPFTRICGIDMRTTTAIAAEIPGKPFMTGVKLSSWDGSRQLFVLEIASLHTICKSVGPFILEDHRDLAAKDWYLRSDSASLSRNLMEIGKLLFYMIKPFQEPTIKPPSKLKPKSETNPAIFRERLVRLPPELRASPFACAITQPNGIETILRANLAMFCPTETGIILEGHVRVNAHHQTCLTAEHMTWRVSAQELNVQGDYSLRTGEREIKGRGACFSISGGGLKSVKLTTQIHPRPGELQAATQMAHMVMGGSATRYHFGKKDILSHLSRMLLQIMPAAIVAMPREQGLPSANFRGKAPYSSYRKPITYPAPLTKYTLEETFERELFCEKPR